MMFAFEAPLFWYKLVFMGELVAAEALATYTLKKRMYFFARLPLCLAAVFAAAFLYPLPPFGYNAVYSSAMFLLLFGVTLVALKVCYDEPWVNLLFCGIIAYTTQHLAFGTFNYIVTVLDLVDVFAVYGSTGAGDYNAFTVIVYCASYAVIYWLVWAFVEYRIRRQDDLKIDNLSLPVIAAVIIAVDIVLNAVVTYNSENLSKVIYGVLFVYNLLSCSLSIGMLFSLLGRKLAEKEIETLQNLWAQDKKYYELSKSNVELINVKCHDLKKQIRALRMGGGEVDKEALKEIESAVNIYDGAVKTGNEVLDVILAEKTLYCEKHGIDLTCMVDGEKLGFMSAADIYSLFENAIQNAIESVSKTSDREKRIIRLKVTAAGEMLSVHIENYCADADKLRFVGGLPQTTKEDERYHGFGVRSMRMTVEKYGGGFRIAVIGNMFNLDAFIPVRCKQGNKTD